MKAWTLTAAALAATLTLAGCAEDAPGVAAVPAPAPGDPAIYAPDGWPLQIGDRVSYAEKYRLWNEFELPDLPPIKGTPIWRGIVPLHPSPWKGYLALHLVGDQVYAAMIEHDPTKVGDYPYVYRGHFPIRFPDGMRTRESDLPPEYHGKVEYATWPPDPLRPGDSLGHYVVLPGQYDADGRVQKLDPNYVPDSPDPLMWPDYPERRK